MPSFSLLPGRARDIGGFSVRRTLPSVQHRLIGPFIFWDHMGPVRLEPGHGMDVRPHPHINLATVTYLFEGEIVHKDSLGSNQSIRPGDVNWMTAGRGIVHSERTGAAQRKAGLALHGLQSWVALPTELEETEPTFQHVEGKSLPELAQPGALLRVIAGTTRGPSSRFPRSTPSGQRTSSKASSSATRSPWRPGRWRSPKAAGAGSSARRGTHA